MEITCKNRLIYKLHQNQLLLSLPIHTQLKTIWIKYGANRTPMPIIKYLDEGMSVR